MSRPRLSPIFHLLQATRLPGSALICLLLCTGELYAQDTASAPAASAAPANGDDNAAGTPAGAEPNSSYSQQPIEPGIEGLERVHNLPPGAFGEDRTGIPYSAIPLLERTGADVNSLGAVQGNFVNSNISAPAKYGSAEGSVGVQTINGNLHLPLFRAAPEPEDANIKAGPFFIKFHSIDGLVLYTDNFDRSENDRRADTLVLLRLNLSIVAQLTEDLQLAVTGAIAYLPIQNQVGLETNSWNSLGLFLDALPSFAAQLAYDTMIGDWPVVFADDFRAAAGAYADNTGDNFSLFDTDYLDRERSGTYTFHSNRTGGESTSQNAVTNEAVSYFSNTISALTDRLLPGDARLTMRIRHEDLWYNTSNRGLPPGRDDFLAMLASERQNERFKPYLTYDASYVEGGQGLTQSFTAGIFGPIDDRLFMRAYGGAFIDTKGHEDALYGLVLQHDAGPYTYEELSVQQGLAAFDEEEATTAYYRLDQALAPAISGRLFLAYENTRDLTNQGIATFTDDIGGAQVTWLMGPKTNLSLAGIYQHQKYEGGSKSDTITGRATLSRTITDTLTFQLLYQYQRSVSNGPGQSYYENLVYLRVIKLLD